MEAPRLPTIFKQNRARQFEFMPRYYDERKERIEELKRKYEKEGKTLEGQRTLSKGSLRQGWQQHEGRSAQVGSSNRMLLVIVLALFLLTYLIITY